ncbi:hypothetical protein [Rhizobium ruizarguesonis]|uniref:hypothetical protein n=1 Tax=Rhizobium ruizarguesonis TaxID=2081791 RepID=UPI00102F6234|nr:hypothetical protein [Rhizobium ruizarguesonis]
MRIITLATIPPRFRSIGPTLKSLLTQRGRIDAINLYVPNRYRRFPDYDGRVPELPAGINLIKPENDIGRASNSFNFILNNCRKKRFRCWAAIGKLSFSW